MKIAGRMSASLVDEKVFLKAKVSAKSARTEATLGNEKNELRRALPAVEESRSSRSNCRELVYFQGINNA